MPDPTATAWVMCAAMRHRGPDGGGVTTFEQTTLAMVRLAIVDIEGGQQPMLSNDGLVALVFNGEVYNAVALRRELAADGVQFQTRSDTEVILRLYERDPDHVEEHLVGMWAFAIHDRRRHKLVLSRDRFGIKPLFVADDGKGLAFASDLRAMVPVREPLARLFAVDRGAAHAMISWAYVPNLDTIYSGVKRLAPGHRLEVDLRSGERRTSRYWYLRPSAEASVVRSLDEACELVAPVLRRAVLENLESDVPVASFLSGGIDSSLVAAAAADVSTRPVELFTIGFREPRFDESPFARETARRLGMSCHVEYFDEPTARASIHEAMAAYDEPFGDSSSLATFLLSRVVGRTHKVALGGDGGDEIFAGYTKHRIIGVRELTWRVPRLRELAAAALGMLPVRTDRTSTYTNALRVARRTARALGGDDAAAFMTLSQVASLDKSAPLVVERADFRRFEEPLLRLFNETPGSQLTRTLTGDLANALPNDLLTKVDRASMACHLEARVPLLDHRLAELGLGLPARYTLGGKGKRVLRELHRRRFGRALANRKKMGFGVPVEAWMRGSLEGECARVFDRSALDRHGVLSSKTLGDGGWKEWRAKDPQVLWHCFALAVWCENNLA
jgi:asparagine synthase (glutamine-hydrolysing)